MPALMILCPSELNLSLSNLHIRQWMPVSIGFRAGEYESHQDSPNQCLPNHYKPPFAYGSDSSKQTNRGVIRASPSSSTPGEFKKRQQLHNNEERNLTDDTGLRCDQIAPRYRRCAVGGGEANQVIHDCPNAEQANGR